ncbi:MAG: hypothetical protein HYY37_04000 [Candidatus Aenigmarchaeota archaeon]|nr:hypothetical protein [Candidatus Aenigmarchaeota archaeon]
MSEAQCCGTRMTMKLELGRFTELQCQKCGDIVYTKNYSFTKTILIDD